VTGAIGRRSPGVGRRANRPLSVLIAIVIVIAMLAGIAAALPASAHNTLTGSDPADRSTASTAPTTVTLTFDQPVQNYQPVLTVSGPNGNRFSGGPPTVSGNQVSIAVSGAGPAGSYVAAYRVISADGHPVIGKISYTLAEAAAGSAVGEAPPPGEAVVDAGSDSGSSGLGVWLWLGIGVAVLLVAAAVVVIVRQSAAAESAEDD